MFHETSAANCRSHGGKMLMGSTGGIGLDEPSAINRQPMQLNRVLIALQA